MNEGQLNSKRCDDLIHVHMILRFAYGALAQISCARWLIPNTTILQGHGTCKKWGWWWWLGYDCHYQGNNADLEERISSHMTELVPTRAHCYKRVSLVSPVSLLSQLLSPFMPCGPFLLSFSLSWSLSLIPIMWCYLPWTFHLQNCDLFSFCIIQPQVFHHSNTKQTKTEISQSL